MSNGYYIISKIDKLPFVKYKGDALRLINQTPKSVDEVIIGIKNKPDIKRKITTFRNSNGQIIERAFDYSEAPYKNRIYKYKDNIIGAKEYVDSTYIKEYTIPRQQVNNFIQMCKNKLPRTLLWSLEKDEANHCSQNLITNEKILTKVTKSNLNKPKKEIHTFIQYPSIISGKIQKRRNKILQFMINTLKNNEVVKNSEFCQDTKFPEKDSFLGFRALDIDDLKETATYKFLKKRGINHLKITVNPEYLAQDKLDELAKALFNPYDGTINFRKSYIYKSKSEVIETARHEVEHGWQFYLHSLNTGGSTPWEIKNAFYQRNLPRKYKEEAQRYTESIQSYVPLDENKEKYRQNYIEQKAKEAGFSAKNLYDYERLEILEQFPHIPVELL